MATESPQPLPELLSIGIRRLRRRRVVIFAVVAVLIFLVAVDVVTWQQAAWLLAFALIGAVLPLPDPGAARAPADGNDGASAGWPIEGLISGLPDAVIVLDLAGQVVAWNAAAQVIAPSLVAGTALSLALR